MKALANKPRPVFNWKEDKDVKELAARIRERWHQYHRDMQKWHRFKKRKGWI